MKSCTDLKNRWRGLLEQGEGACNFDLEKLTPGRFCVLYSDVGGSMACHSAIEVVGFFEDARDFLSFLRFAEIPRVLDFDTGTNRDPFPDVADAYLLDYGGEQRDGIDRLIGLIDRSLKGEMISASELCLVRDVFNEIFHATNPQVEIMAWGSLAEILRSDDLQEAFEEAVEEEMDEKLSTLRTLLDADEFDENDEEHLALARGFVERSISVY